MKDGQIRMLILTLLLVLLLLFPLTPKGEQLISDCFPSVNYGENELILEPTPEPRPEETPSPTPVPLLLSDYYTELTAELPASYTLVSICTESDSFSDALLLQIRQWGFPMALELYADGTGFLRIFDQTEDLIFHPDSMLLSFQVKTVPFFFLDGRLRVHVGCRDLIFEKQT